MTYRALYRVWRPARFADLVGQSTIAQTLRNALLQNRLSHAYLFTGGRGTGKTSTAKILAKAVNCLDLQNGEPCNACPHCLAITQDRYMDVVEIDAASNRGIDEMRQLKENIHFAPSQGPKKVYIIDEVHMLTTEAFNALLKTLEEPPSHVLFILATTDPQKIPATILSRTQRFDFRRIPHEAIADHLATIAKAEAIPIDEEAIDLIAHASDGGLRDAVSLLDQASAYGQGPIGEDLIAKLLGQPSRKALRHLLEAIGQKDYQAIFRAGRLALGEAGDPASFLRALTAQLRDLLIARVMHPATSLPESLAPYTLPKLEELLSRSLEAEADLKRLPDGDLIVETTLFAMTRVLHEDPSPSPPQPTPVPLRSKPADKPTPSPQKQKAQPQTPAPVSQPHPSSPPKEAKAGDLQDLWLEVMHLVKGASVRTHALLREAYPRALDQGVLTLTFPKTSDFHYRQMQEPAQKAFLTHALAQVFGPATGLNLILQGQDEDPSPKEGAGLSQDLVQTTKDIFGDVPMEISPTPHPYDTE